MELLYVWIENYKNIYHQGFNFSSEFYFIFNPENRELAVERKEDSNLFKDYCINLTAIIGKNGSSKTTLLEFLLSIALEDENDEIYNSIPRILGDIFFIILFDNLEKKFVIAGKDDIKILDDKIKNNYIPKQFSGIRKQINTMYYSPFFTGNLLIEEKENAQDISVNNYGKINSYKIDEVTNQIAFCLDNNELVEKYVSTPHILEIIISINDNNYQEKEETSDESYYEKIKKKINKFYNENNFITLFLAKQKEKIKNSWEDLSQVEISKDDVLFLIAFDTLNDFIKKKFDPSHEEFFYKITSDNYQELEDRIFWIFNLGENKNSAIQKYDLINDFCSSFIQYGEQDKKYKDNLIYSILEDIKKLKGYIDSISNAKYIYRKGTITI